MPEEEGSARVQKINRTLSKAWESGLLPRPRLEAASFERTALGRKPAGSFGADEAWREPYERLIRSLDEEADLNPLGLVIAHGQIVMNLKSRIRAATLWKAHPEILSRPLLAPIIILGQMRSGTTRLHRLLACDDRFSHMRLQESLIPVPFGRRSRLHDRRKIYSRLGHRLLQWLNPVLDRIHPTGPDAPEEEFGLISFSFGSAQFEAQWRIPAFSRWWEAADRASLYREFRALLRTAAWCRGDSPSLIPILKVPWFLEDVHALIQAFPDARFIRLDRNPADIVASSASLVWNQMRLQSDSADRAWIGQEWLRKTRLRAERCNAALERRSDAIRIGYEEMGQDWRGAVERIYRELGLPLDAVTLARMEAFVKGATRHYGHEYQLDRFGLSSLDFPETGAPA